MAFWFETSSCAHEPAGIDAARVARAEVPGAEMVIDVGLDSKVAI